MCWGAPAPPLRRLLLVLHQCFGTRSMLRRRDRLATDAPRDALCASLMPAAPHLQDRWQWRAPRARRRAQNSQTPSEPPTRRRHQALTVAQPPPLLAVRPLPSKPQAQRVPAASAVASLEARAPTPQPPQRSTIARTLLPLNHLAAAAQQDGQPEAAAGCHHESRVPRCCLRKCMLGCQCPTGALAGLLAPPARHRKPHAPVQPEVLAEQPARAPWHQPTTLQQQVVPARCEVEKTSAPVAPHNSRAA